MADSIAFGLFSMNSGACSTPDGAMRLAQSAEEAGFDSLWAGEHVVVPDPQVPPSPMAPTDPILDPVVALTFLAAHTQRVRLGTGIIILPQRNPLVLAKELASLDVLSGGRLLVGIGVGYLEPELRALGVAYSERGARTDDYLAAMRAIWSEPQPAYSGQFVSFSGVQAYPHPQQRPYPPIVVGGHTPAAFRRAVEVAHGWYGFHRSLAATAQDIVELRSALEHYERPATLGALEISVTPWKLPTRDEARRYADLGVHRLILMPPDTMDVEMLERYVATAGETLIGQV